MKAPGDIDPWPGNQHQPLTGPTTLASSSISTLRRVGLERINLNRIRFKIPNFRLLKIRCCIFIIFLPQNAGCCCWFSFVSTFIPSARGDGRKVFNVAHIFYRFLIFFAERVHRVALAPSSFFFISCISLQPACQLGGAHNRTSVISLQNM